MKKICVVSGEEFEVSKFETCLRAKFNLVGIDPEVAPWVRFRQIGAFWPHWNLHRRKCDRTEKFIVSIFSKDCVYPIWNRDEWMRNSNPPGAEFDESQEIFPQLWKFFQKSPLPHTFQSHNQNCEYTDDWYHSKNCYLCHSGEYSENCRYSYGCDGIQDVSFGIFSFHSELCLDLINSARCFDSFYLLSCKNIQNSGFLYDCRNCKNCLFCFNLRNKEYCFGNQQLTKEVFEKKKQEWNFSSTKKYQKAKEFFTEMMHTMAWHRALQLDHCENSTGDFLKHTKDCENCYLLSKHEDCANVAFCGPDAKSVLDSIGTIGAELVYMTSLPVYSYEARYCFSVSNCKFVTYSAYLQNCKYCFGCCGLMNEQYCVFNKKYSKHEYFFLIKKIEQQMWKTGEWGSFFPGYFAPNPYEESFSGFHFPLSSVEQKGLGFRSVPKIKRDVQKTAELSDIPDGVKDLTSEKIEWLTEQVFWDEKFKRPFQIQLEDITFAQKLGTPLPREYYIGRIQESARWLFFKGKLRNTTCSLSGEKIQTGWPKEYDGRILSEKEYLKVLG